MSPALDDTTALVHALRVDHDIELIDESRAHDFIRLDFRSPFDLCVFELANRDEYRYVWPYLLHRPGLLRLRSRSLFDSRAALLRAHRRTKDFANERRFSGWELLGAPISASRLTVVSSPHVAARLAREYPQSHVRHVPIALGFNNGGAVIGNAPVVVGRLGDARRGSTERAVARARLAGASLELMTDASPERVVNDADVIVAVDWRPVDELTGAIAGMAARKVVVVCDTEDTAWWPAIDPQSWQPRGWIPHQRPVVVSIDPRDEEHSLFLALHRLAGDLALRQQISAAAFEWCQTHATVQHAANAWRALLQEAASLPDPPRPPDYPAHLHADGTEHAREILGEFGTPVDFLN